MTLHRPGHGDDTTGKRVLAKGALRRPLPGLHLGLLTPRLAWEAYGNSGILRDQPNPKDPSTWVWHAGHVTAVIDLGPADPRGVSLGDLLLASQTGGVFRLTTDRNDSRIVHAAPLSHGWDNPDVYALAHGPDGAGHFFAGCRDVHYVTDLVYESAPGSALPNDQSWRPVASVSDGLSWVHAVAVASLAA